MLGKPQKLNPQFRQIMDQIESSMDHFMISGKAGTGKSTLLRMFQQISKKRIATLAPTGVAALNVRGQTIHSFFGFAPRLFTGQKPDRKKNRRKYCALDTIIIDEISMVRADLLDQIDQFLKVQRASNEAFGGVQMIFFGDMFQLPPVVRAEHHIYFKEHYESPYFFSAKVMLHQVDLHMIHLEEVFRQRDRAFVRLLDEIRTNSADWDTLESLNERIDPEFEAPNYYITLASRNAIVEKINSERLYNINAPGLHFQATTTGEFPIKNAPTNPILELKEGAQIMCLRNGPQLNYVNGTIGIFDRMEDRSMVIRITDSLGDEKEVKIKRVIWEMVKYEWNQKQLEAKVIGTFEQYPVKLAWAVTIHKSQGQTFDHIYLDMGKGAFEFGQTYVALSRCTSLSGIVLRRALRMHDVLVDERIVDFYQAYR